MLTRILVASILFSSQLIAQWVQTNGPYSCNITCLVVKDSILFAGTWDVGIYCSTNKGKNWSKVTTDLRAINALVVKGNNIYAGTDNGIYFSTNDGISWVSRSNELSNLKITSLAISESCLFAGTEVGIFRSSNDGETWVSINKGLIDTVISVVFHDSKNLYIGTGGLRPTIFRSSDEGMTWIYATGNLSLIYATCFGTKGDSTFIGTYGDGVFLSTDYGFSWKQINNGLVESSSDVISSLVIDSNNIFIGTPAGVYHSTDYGTHWIPINSNLTNKHVEAIVVNDTNIFVGTWGGIYSSSKNIPRWKSINTGLIPASIYALALKGNILFAGSEENGIFRSTDDGKNWKEANNFLSSSYVRTLLVSGNDLLAGTLNGICRSTNDGDDWTQVGLAGCGIGALIEKKNLIFAGTLGEGVYRSDDNGTNWNAVGKGMSDSIITSLVINGSNIFAGTHHGIFRSSNDGQSWTEVNAGLTSLRVTTMIADGKNIFAGTLDEGLFFSANNGMYWEQVNVGLRLNFSHEITALAMKSTSIFAATLGEIFVSSDNGKSWKTTRSELMHSTTYAFASNDSILYVGNMWEGVWKRPLLEMLTPYQLQEKFSLDENYPNPFNLNTTISFRVIKRCNIQLKIYNLLGELIATLVNEIQDPGYKTVTFDGNGLSTGVYFYRLTTGEFTQTKKMLLVK